MKTIAMQMINEGLMLTRAGYRILLGLEDEGGGGGPAGDAYLRPGGVDYYKRPGGTDFYQRP